MSRQNGAAPEDIRKPVQTPYIASKQHLQPGISWLGTCSCPVYDADREPDAQTAAYVRQVSDRAGSQDMRSEIQMEFLRLHSGYDPARGVDFPGYISMNLTHAEPIILSRLQVKNRDRKCCPSEITESGIMPKQSRMKKLKKSWTASTKSIPSPSYASRKQGAQCSVSAVWQESSAARTRWTGGHVC